MNWEQLKKKQISNVFSDLRPANDWSSEQSNPIEDVKKGVELASKCESFYMRSMRWLFGRHLENNKN